jgi:hypothetical protein
MTHGETFEVPDVCVARFEVKPDEPSMCMALAVYGYHLFSVAAFPPGGRLDKRITATDHKRLAWPRERST